MKKLERRKAKLAQVRQQDYEETPTPQKDSIDGIRKLANDWGQKQMRSFAKLRKSVGENQGAKLWRALRETGVKVYGSHQRMAHRLRRLGDDHPRKIRFGRGVALGLAHLAKIKTSVDVPGMLEAGETAAENAMDEYAGRAVRDALLDVCKTTRS